MSTPGGSAVRWSVGLEAQGDRVLTTSEVVELADAVAGSDGIASGIGTTRYGAQLVVEAGTREEAIAKATDVFLAAARTAGLPTAPIVRTEAISEADEEAGDPDGYGLEGSGLDGSALDGNGESR
jgi:hypothetical protein